MSVSPVRKRTAKQVVVGGKIYNSITEFCDAHGLKYPSVSAQLRKGVAPEDILANHGNLPTTTRYKSGSKAAHPCAYDGVEYPSMMAAADALGIPAHRITTCMKTRQCSASDAIRHLMEDNDGEVLNTGNQGKREPCVVEGVLYPSKSAACQAYGVRYITIHSRMTREGLTFEEALASGGVTRRHIQPMLEQWTGNPLKPFLPAEENSAFMQVSNTLKKAGLDPIQLYDVTRNMAAIKVAAPLHAISDVRSIYFLLPYSSLGQLIDIEIIIPYLYDMVKDVSSDTLFSVLNSVNQKYTGITLSVSIDHIQASSLITLFCGHINNRILLRRYQRFIGTASAIFDELKAALEDA